MAVETSENRTAWITGSMLGAGVLLAVAIFAMVNYLSLRHFKRFDWTSSKLYTLSEKTENVLAGLDREVDAVVFLSPGSELYGPVNELLSRYEAANPRYFKKRVIDPAKNILEARRLVEQYDVKRQNVIVVTAGDDRRIIDELDLAEYDYSGAQFGQGPSLKEFKGEQQITSAILELIEAKKPKIVLTTGHGEANQELSKAKIRLGSDNFEIEEWSPAETLQVPADADLVVVAGPTTRFFQPELDLFTSYLAGGGRMLLLLDPLGSGGLLDDPLLRDWLAGYGVAVGDNVVIDPSIQVPFLGPESLFTASYGAHPIVENLDKGRRPVVLSVARSIEKSDPVPDGYHVTELIKTSPESWGETDIQDVDNLAAGDDELHGPLSVAVAVSFEVEKPEAAADDAGASSGEDTSDASDVSDPSDPSDMSDLSDEETADEEGSSADEGAPKPPEARLVVFGDVDFAADSQIESAANAELLVNTFNWLVQREKLIAIEGRKPQETRLSFGIGELSSVRLLVMLILPGLAVITGVSVYLRRRR